jgi:hypothetical protein
MKKTETKKSRDTVPLSAEGYRTSLDKSNFSQKKIFTVHWIKFSKIKSTELAKLFLAV